MKTWTAWCGFPQNSIYKTEKRCAPRQERNTGWVGKWGGFHTNAHKVLLKTDSRPDDISFQGGIQKPSEWWSPPVPALFLLSYARIHIIHCAFLFALPLGKLRLRSIQVIPSKYGRHQKMCFFEPTSHVVPFIFPILNSLPHFLKFFMSSHYHLTIFVNCVWFTWGMQRNTADK